MNCATVNFTVTASFSGYQGRELVQLVKKYKEKINSPSSPLKLDPKGDLSTWIKDSGDVVITYGTCNPKKILEYNSVQLYLEDVKKHHNLCSMSQPPYINLDKGFYLTKIFYPHFKTFFPGESLENENNKGVMLALVPKQHTLSAILYHMFKKDISDEYKLKYFKEYVQERRVCAMIPLCIGEEAEPKGLHKIATYLDRLHLESCFFNNIEGTNRKTINPSKKAVYLKKLNMFIPEKAHISWNWPQQKSCDSSRSRRKYYFYLDGEGLTSVVRENLGIPCMNYLMRQKQLSAASIWTIKPTLHAMDHITFFVAYLASTQQCLDLVKRLLSTFQEKNTTILKLTLSTKFDENFNSNILAFPLNEPHTLEALKKCREDCILFLQGWMGREDFQLANKDKHFNPHITFLKSEKNSKELIQIWNDTGANVTVDKKLKILVTNIIKFAVV